VAALHAGKKRMAGAQAPADPALEEMHDLSFLQAHRSSAAHRAAHGEAPLYPVSVQVNYRHFDASQGITIRMDKATRTLTVVNGVNTSGIAWGRLTDKLSTTGWIELLVETSDSRRVSNDVKMYGAGFVEGLLTAVRTSQFYANFYQTMMKDYDSQEAYTNVQNMFWDQQKYVREKAHFTKGPAETEPTDPYWRHARYIYVQLWGMKDGYNHMARLRGVNMINMIDLMVINAHAEMPELLEIYSDTQVKQRRTFQERSAGLDLLQRGDRKNASAAAPAGGANGSALVKHNDTDSSWLANLTDANWERRLARHGHCSSLVRLSPNNRDLFVGHTTWNDYAKMTRIWKYYNFKLPGSLAATTLMGFSSYPGCVSSTDDFYIMDSGLSVMDTSLEILNPVIYNRVAEFPANKHIPNFMQVMVVNRLARSAGHWTTLFTERNNGMNSAQWTIVDYNQFTPGGTIGHDLLRVVEQVPGYSRHADMSAELLTKGYWASYNRPFFNEVRDMTGHTAAQETHGDLYSYANGPRALIFKRLSNAVTDLFDMRSLMNRNNFPHEGVKPNMAGHAISARMDMDSGIPNGGIDAKVTNACLFRRLQCQAISGPSHDKEPVFRWRRNGKEVFPGWPHFGLPDVWNFNWVQMTPSAMLPKLVDPQSC
jgi:hypothetical protein